MYIYPYTPDIYPYTPDIYPYTPDIYPYTPDIYPYTPDMYVMGICMFVYTSSLIPRYNAGGKSGSYFQTCQVEYSIRPRVKCI